jgi:hypothetical protein
MAVEVGLSASLQVNGLYGRVRAVETGAVLAAVATTLAPKQDGLLVPSSGD